MCTAPVVCAVHLNPLDHRTLTAQHVHCSVFPKLPQAHSQAKMVNRVSPKAGVAPHVQESCCCTPLHLQDNLGFRAYCTVMRYCA
jgi:hypothetical protein